MVIEEHKYSLYQNLSVLKSHESYLDCLYIFWDPISWHLPGEGILAVFKECCSPPAVVQGETWEEVQLAVCVFLLEGVPQFLLLGMVQVYLFQLCFLIIVF